MCHKLNFPEEYDRSAGEASRNDDSDGKPSPSKSKSPPGTLPISHLPNIAHLPKPKPKRFTPSRSRDLPASAYTCACHICYRRFTSVRGVSLHVSKAHPPPPSPGLALPAVEASHAVNGAGEPRKSVGEPRHTAGAPAEKSSLWFPREPTRDGSGLAFPLRPPAAGGAAAVAKALAKVAKAAARAVEAAVAESMGAGGDRSTSGSAAVAKAVAKTAAAKDTPIHTPRAGEAEAQL
eukprot:1175854-Prorocentrum_minimum.AAC.2